MSVEPAQLMSASDGDSAPVSPEQIPVEGRDVGVPAVPIDSEEGPDMLRAKVSCLQLKLEEVQSESSLLKEWGARVELYVDCLVDALETNHITYVYDVDGSLVSLDECRQKAKTLPHTRKPHCDEDLRSKQYAAEIDKLHQEIAVLKADLEDSLQRSSEQDYLIEQLQTAEYQANCRWEAYYENAMQQWSKCYTDLQGQYNNTVVRLQNLNTAYNNLKKTASAAGRNQTGQYNRADPFRRFRSAPVRRDVVSAMPSSIMPGQYSRRNVTAAGERMNSGYQSRNYRGHSEYAPVLPRAERVAILKQFFTNLNMIQQRQQQLAGARRIYRRYEPRRRPGPYGEAN